MMERLLVPRSVCRSIWEWGCGCMMDVDGQRWMVVRVDSHGVWGRLASEARFRG
jgi:hypothetical protein